MLSVAESEFTGKEGRKMVGGGEKEGGVGREGDREERSRKEVSERKL